MPSDTCRFRFSVCYILKSSKRQWEIFSLHILFNLIHPSLVQGDQYFLMNEVVYSLYHFFFILRPQNPVCVLCVLYLPVWTSHISHASLSPVLLGQHNAPSPKSEKQVAWGGLGSGWAQTGQGSLARSAGLQAGVPTLGRSLGTAPPPALKTAQTYQLGVAPFVLFFLYLPHVNEIIRFVSFSIQLISLSTILSSSIYNMSLQMDTDNRRLVTREVRGWGRGKGSMEPNTWWWMETGLRVVSTQ